MTEPPCPQSESGEPTSGNRPSTTEPECPLSAGHVGAAWCGLRHATELTATQHSSGHALLDGTDRWQCKCGEILHCGADWNGHSNLYRRPEPPPLPTEHESVERLVAALNDVLKPEGVIQWLTTQAERLESAADGAFS